MFTKYKLRFKGKLKFLLLIFLIAILLIAAKYFNIQEFLYSLINQVNSLGIWGPIAYIGIYNLATLLFVPGSLLTFKGGCLFGLFWGSIYVLIAAMIGATSAFLIGRYLSRDWVANQINQHPKLKAIDLAVAKEGWKIVLLTRLCPVFPFNLLNYVFGVTQVSLKDYILGSFGIIPGTVIYVYIGSLAGNLAISNLSDAPMTPESQFYQYIIQAIGLIATITVTIYVTKVAQKALHQSMVITKTVNERGKD